MFPHVDKQVILGNGLSLRRVPLPGSAQVAELTGQRVHLVAQRQNLGSLLALKTLRNLITTFQ